MATLLHRVVVNSSVVAAGRILSKILSFVYLLFLGNLLDKDAFGLYQTALAFVLFFGVFAEFGFDRILIRDINQSPEREGEILGNGLWTIASFILVAVLCANLIAPFYDTAETLVLIHIASLVLFQRIQNAFMVVYQSRLEMGYPFVVNLANRILALILLCLVILAGLPLWILVLVEALSSTPSTILLGLSAFKRAAWNLRPRLRTMIRITKDALPLGLTSVIMMLYFRVDVLMIKAWQGAVPVADYSMAVKFVEPFMVVPHALMVSLFPLLSSRFLARPREAVEWVHSSVRILMVLLMILVIPLCFEARTILEFFFGEKYEGSVLSMMILAWSLFFIALNYCYAPVITIKNRQKIFILFYSILFALNVGLNWIWIPRIGILGAAFATLLTEGMGSLLILTFTLYWDRVGLPKNTLRILGMVVFGAVLFLWIQSYPLLLRGVLYPPLLFSLIVLLRVLESGDWQRLGRLLGPVLLRLSLKRGS